MPLHRTLEAANDLDLIADYLFEHTTGRTVGVPAQGTSPARVPVRFSCP